MTKSFIYAINIDSKGDWLTDINYHEALPNVCTPSIFVFELKTLISNFQNNDQDCEIFPSVFEMVTVKDGGRFSHLYRVYIILVLAWKSFFEF